MMQSTLLKPTHAPSLIYFHNQSHDTTCTLKYENPCHAETLAAIIIIHPGADECRAPRRARFGICIFPLPPDPAPSRLHPFSLPPLALPVVSLSFPFLLPPSLPSFLHSFFPLSCRNYIASNTRINTYSLARAFFGGGASGPSATPGDQRSLSETALVQRSGAVEARSFSPRSTSSNNSRRRPRGTPS